MNFFRKFTSRIRVLPLLILVAALSFSLRLGDFMMGVNEYSIALAKEEMSEDDHSGEMDYADDSDLTTGTNDGDGTSVEEIENFESWEEAEEADMIYSETNVELYQDLAERRRDLEKREKELAVKEALLNAAEKELNQKVRELSAIRDEMKILMERQSKEADERIGTLVRVYEAMKAKDAARIFNTLDIDVLVQVMSRMSERKLSPILAEMEPERARTITMMLAQNSHMPAIVQ